MGPTQAPDSTHDELVVFAPTHPSRTGCQLGDGFPHTAEDRDSLHSDSGAVGEPQPLTIGGEEGTDSTLGTAQRSPGELVKGMEIEPSPNPVGLRTDINDLDAIRGDGKARAETRGAG